MSSCLVCGGSIQPFVSFGRMPIANGFLTPAEYEREFFFELEAGRCPACHMAQLTNLVPPSKLFHDAYAFLSSTSSRMSDHFGELARDVMAGLREVRDPFVVELGSNDGILLRHVAAAKMRHLGIEPSANVAKVAMERGVNTVVRFFDEETARAVRDEHGRADVVLGANVICHLPNIHSVVKGLGPLLKDDGVFIFEEPYLGDIVEKASYDQIYDEHVFYFCVTSLDRLFEQYGMEIVDVAPQAVHGGSMRYTVARAGKRQAAPVVEAQRAKEASLGLLEAATFDRWRDRVHQSRDQLHALLVDLKARGQRVVGYGATSKSTTVTNFCQIGPDLVEFISDTTPTKQGKFSPGVHIPVLPYDRFREQYPPYALLFAWNHGQEIMAKEQEFKRSGGRFIGYVPSVGVLD